MRRRRAAAAPKLVDLHDHWLISLQARNLSPATPKAYSQGLRDLLAFAAAQDSTPELHELDTSHLTRELLRDWQVDLVARAKGNTAVSRLGAVKQFVKWLAAEELLQAGGATPQRAGEPNGHLLDASPTASLIASPIRVRVAESPVPLLSDATIAQLLKACQGRDLLDRRDTALIRLFMDTGARRAELTDLKLSDVDLELRLITVMGKGRRVRTIPFGAKTHQALNRYLLLRKTHAFADLECLWIGERGAFGRRGTQEMLLKRCRQAGIPSIHPHQFRHTFAHAWLDKGGTETGLMSMAGWRSRTMLIRYGSAARDTRARDEFRRLSLGDRV